MKKQYPAGSAGKDDFSSLLLPEENKKIQYFGLEVDYEYIQYN
jgi:hypothetical protein